MLVWHDIDMMLHSVHQTPTSPPPQANYVIPAFMCIMILLIFQIPAYVSHSNLPAVIALFLMYG